MKVNRLLFCALFGVLSGSVFAVPTLTLTLDPAAAGPEKFAAEETRSAAAARGMSVVCTVAKAPEWKTGSIDEVQIKRSGKEAGFRK